MGLTFSPDGRYVYYLEKGQETGTLFRVPKLGGTPEKLLDHVNTPVTFAPGGERFAFVRYDVGKQTTILMTARADGTDEGEVAKRYPPAGFTLGGFHSSGPAWSPDGKVIACPILNTSGPLSSDVIAISLGDGTQRRINSSGWASIERITWLKDGSGLLMNAADSAESPYQLWLLSYEGGEARRITNDPNSYDSVSASRDSNTLVTVKSDQLSTIWVSSGGDLSSIRQIPNSKYKGSNGILWTPGGQLVYTSNESDIQSIWRMESDGLEPRQLTSGLGASVQPAASADGRYLAFVSYRAGIPHIWRADADGANPKQLTNGMYEDAPQFTPDGKWIIYHSIHPDRDSVWRISIEGGAPELLSKILSVHPVVSPDGKTIASFSRDDQPTAPWRIALMHSDSGEPYKWFELPATVDVTWPALRWEPDGHALTYIATVNGVSNIWRQDLDGGSAVKLTDFKEEQIFSFAWSADGRQLACVRGQQTSDVIMISGFR
jgi:Tol biopolymer transport system component